MHPTERKGTRRAHAGPGTARASGRHPTGSETLPLYSYFCDFYATLLEVKRALSAVPRDLAAQQRAPELAPAAVHQRLLEQLRAQYGTVQQDFTPDQLKLYRDAQYAMAALADEQLLLEVDWPGKAEWLNLMLESALFDKRMAGVGFYRLIDRLLGAPIPTQAHAELGLVLLGALEVGFRGELRGKHEANSLAQRRQELIHFVCKVRGDQPRRHAFEQAYAHPIGPAVPEPADCRLAPLSPWLNAARLALIAYLLVSGAIWFGTILPFEHRVAVEAASQQAHSVQWGPQAPGTADDHTQASGAVSASPTGAGAAGSPIGSPAPRDAVAPNAAAQMNSPQGGVQ